MPEGEDPKQVPFTNLIASSRSGLSRGRQRHRPRASYLLTARARRGEAVAVKLDVKPLSAGREYQLRMAFTLPEEEKWARAGFEVASPSRFGCRSPRLPAPPISLVKPLSFTAGRQANHRRRRRIQGRL